MYTNRWNETHSIWRSHPLAKQSLPQCVSRKAFTLLLPALSPFPSSLFPPNPSIPLSHSSFNAIVKKNILNDEIYLKENVHLYKGFLRLEHYKYTMVPCGVFRYHECLYRIHIVVLKMIWSEKASCFNVVYVWFVNSVTLWGHSMHHTYIWCKSTL